MGSAEVASWILSFGPHAKVLASPRLQAVVTEQLRAALGLYADPTAPQDA
ncbi:MAG: hypothetical protein KAI47_02860 [Deltaproteobacteria bacterium]|nr:hypothetical protein [Deltaproteobacteria bacterium]